MRDKIKELLAQVDFEAFYRSKVRIKSQTGDELHGLCCFHEDKESSFSANKTNGLWKCFACGLSGTIFQFIQKLENVDFNQAFEILANFAGVPIELNNPKVEEKKARPRIDSKLPQRYLDNLLKAERVLNWIQEKKGLTLDTIKKYEIGWDSEKNTVPIYDEKRILRNIRRYNRKKKPKMVSYHSKDFTYGEGRIYGADEIFSRPDETIFLVEGEWDKLLASQHGFLAVTGTVGAQTFKPEWKQYFAGRDVVIIYDMDPEGRRGADNAARALMGTASSVKITELPLKGTKEEKDYSDYFLKIGATPEDIQKLIEESPLFTIEEEPKREELFKVLESFIEIDLNPNIDKRIKVPLTVSGETSEAFHGVSKFRVEFCQQQKAGKCNRCPPDRIFAISSGEKEFIESCMSSEAQVIGFLRYRICPFGPRKPTVKVLEKSTVREFFATQRTKRFFARIGKIGIDEGGTELVERKVYFVSDHPVKPQSYLATGYVRTHPKTQQVCLLATELEPIEEEFESFALNDEARRNLEKIRELTPEKIVDILGEEVLFLRRRTELILAILLTFCSPLRIRFNQIDIRGWINTVVLGDTGTAKCIRGDSLLLTNSGIKKIEDAGEFQTEKFLPISDNLEIFGLANLAKPSQTYKSKRQETIKIVTKLGYILEGTLNHPIICLSKDNQPIFRKLEDVRLGDLVAIQFNQNCFPRFTDSYKIEVPDYFGAFQEFSLLDFRKISRFLGYLIGDGDIGYSDGRIGFTNGNPEIIEDYRKIVKDIFDKDVKAVKDKRSKAISVKFASEDIRNWLEDFGLARVKTTWKEVPKGIFSLDKSNIREFLRGICETDGDIPKRDRIIEISSSSLKLIQELKIILLNFGILTKTQTKFNRQFRRDYYSLILSGRNAKKFVQEIGFISSEKQKLGNKIIASEPKQEYLNWDLSKEFDYLWQKYKKLHPEVCHRNPKIQKLSINTVRQIRYGNRVPGMDVLRKFLELMCELKSDRIYKKLKYLLETNIHWDRITKLELKKNETFDLAIPNDHIFFANGFICHNTVSIARFCDYVEFGDIVSGLSSSRTGITYGLKEHKQKGWMIKIGRYPANTRKFVCIDEIQYLKPRDVRTLAKAMDEGFITIDRIAEKSLESMTRLMALANPKEDGVMDEKMFGCEGFRELFDKAIIRRFDLALCLSHTDIKSNELNLPNIEINSAKVPKQMLQDLIFWAWTRPLESIEIGKETTNRILEKATKLSEKFGHALDVPLATPGDFSNKLARLSTAYAVLCVSSDKELEKVIVKSKHIEFVASLLDYIYSGEAFGLKEYAEIYRKKIQLEDYEEIKKALELAKKREGHSGDTKEMGFVKSRIEKLLYTFKMHDKIRRKELADELDSDEKTVGRKLGLLKKFNLVDSGPNGFFKKPKFIKFLRKLARDKNTVLEVDRPDENEEENEKLGF